MNLNNKEGSARRGIHLPSGKKILKTVVNTAINTAVCTLLSENILSPLHHVSMERRRDAYGVVVRKLFPSDFTDEQQSLREAEVLKKEGYGLVVSLRHFSNSDFFRVMNVLRLASNLTHRGTDVITPLAYHMYTPASRRLFDYFGVRPFPIVTAETVKKGKNIGANGKILPIGEGSQTFVRNATKVLKKGGIVFEAPSKHRVAEHEQWEEPVVEGTLRFSGEKVAHLNVGVDIPNVESYKEKRGLNVGEVYVITLGRLDKKKELINRALEQGISIDHLTANEMALLVRPQTLGESFRELREQLLAKAA